ncbi:MAG: hypothetical protein ABUL58_08325 [Steroidobacter sp.]
MKYIDRIRQLIVTRRQSSKGHRLSLIEIIIGLVLMSSCFFGIAAIYAQHDHRLGGGGPHATAAELSEQMAGIIRNEKDASASFETGLGHTCNNAESIPDIDNEVACWQDDVAKGLSNGNARIVLDNSTVPAQYVITISWTDPRTGTASYVQRVPVPPEQRK